MITDGVHGAGTSQKSTMLFMPQKTRVLFLHAKGENKSMLQQHIAELEHQIMSVKKSINLGQEKLLLEKDSLSDKDHDLIVRQLATMDGQLERMENELALAEREEARRKLAQKHGYE